MLLRFEFSFANRPLFVQQFPDHISKFHADTTRELAEKIVYPYKNELLQV